MAEACERQEDKVGYIKNAMRNRVFFCVLFVVFFDFIDKMKAASWHQDYFGYDPHTEGLVILQTHSLTGTKR